MQNSKCKVQNIRIQNSEFRIKSILSFCIFDAFAWSKSVSRILFFEKLQRGNHSSRLFVAKQLQRPTRKRRPIARHARAGNSLYRFPIWSCTARSLPSRACYHTRWCALTAPFHPSPFPAGLFSVALVVALLKKKAPGRYPARRPSVFGLSSPEKTFGSDCPTCSNFARLVQFNKKCSTKPIRVYKDFQFPISIVSPASKAGSAIFPSLINFKSNSVGTSFPCSSLRRMVTLRVEDFFKPPHARIACVSVSPS